MCISSKEQKQRTKKVVSNSLGLADFAIGLVNSVLNLPDARASDFLGADSNYRRTVINPGNQFFLRAS